MVLRFPLVLYNTGAIPIVVQNLRIRFFPEGRASAQSLPWVGPRSQVKPDKNEGQDFAAVFPVAGRAAHQIFPEFIAHSLDLTLDTRAAAASALMSVATEVGLTASQPGPFEIRATTVRPVPEDDQR